ncbi:MAG TPA: PadR family transcriptional regulator [Jiangellaceae bacterium]
MAERKIENLLGLAVLSYLTQGPMHPYQLSRTLRDNGDARSIKFNHGSLYMVVQQLARAGLIAEVETTRVGQRPERTVYGLTEPGRRELREWLRELVQEPKHEYLQYVAALSLIGALPPDDVVALLRARLRRLEDQRAEIRKLIDNAVGEGVHPLFLVEEDYRLALLDADFAFTEQLIERIENPTTGWRSQWADFHQELA